jgi:hypothetical protein
MTSLPQAPTEPAEAPDEALRSAPLHRFATHLLALGALMMLVAVFFLCMLPVSASDFWWQLKTGEIIVRSGAIPHHDVFSWTAAGQPWTVHEWLTEVLFYLIYEHLPRWMLLGYKCGLGVVACGLVFARARLRTGSLPLGIGAALLAAWVMRNFADLRPQMLSFVLLAGLMLALDQYHAGRLRRLPWALPAVFALWANLHGGVLVGLIVLALWLTGQAVGRLLFKDSAVGLGPLAVGLAASCVAIGLNPNGFAVYLYPFQVLGHPEVMGYISEWWSPNFQRQSMRGFEVALLGTLGALALARRAPAERRLGDLLAALALAHAALTAQRNTVAFAIVAAPLAAAAAAGIWNELRASLPALAVARHPGARFAGAVSLVAALGALITAHVPSRPASKWVDDAVVMSAFPQDAVELLREGMWPGRIYNDYVWGGYLIWELHPRRPVFIDGRAEVYYPTKAFDDEMLIHRVAPGWKDALDRRRVDVVLTASKDDLARALAAAPEWKLAFTGGVEVVYVRKKPLGEEGS